MTCAARVIFFSHDCVCLLHFFSCFLICFIVIIFLLLRYFFFVFGSASSSARKGQSGCAPTSTFKNEGLL